MSEPLPEIDRFAGFGPAFGEWVEFVHEYASWPRLAATLLAAICSSLSDASGRIDFRRIDRERLAAAGVSRKATSQLLREAIAEGFVRLEVNRRGGPVYFVRGDIAREVLDARAGIVREGLRVIPGGKRDA